MAGMSNDLRERLRSALADHGLPPSPALLEKLVGAALSEVEPAPAGERNTLRDAEDCDWDRQVKFWKLDEIPSWVKQALAPMRFGSGNQGVNVYQWDLVRRGFPMDWPIVVSNVRGGYATPPEWMMIHAIDRLLKSHTEQPKGDAASP